MKNSSIGAFFRFSFLACLLGNFVDQYDLFLFGSLRVISLKSLGISGDAALEAGLFLLNIQLVGMLIGGICGGMIGDKVGRLSILFGSIILYSLGNLANAFVQTVPQYAFCRFIAGLGLAGEIGACITMIVETLPAQQRLLGIMCLMATGHIGAVAASIMSNLVSWRINYMIGGVMGLLILVLRINVKEPTIFLKMADSGTSRGNFFKLISSPTNFRKYLSCIVASSPTWLCYAVLTVFAPEIAAHLGYEKEISPQHYLPYHFAGLILGDFCSAWLAYIFKTRKWVIVFYILTLIAISTFYLTSSNITHDQLFAILFLFGFCSGFTVLLYTLAAEQFGTNIRATVATTTPNFVRSFGVLYGVSFGFLKTEVGVVNAATVIATVGLSLALFAALNLQEPARRDLDFLE